MKPVIYTIIIFYVILSFQGCAKRDPLQFRIRAGTPAEFVDWSEENVGKMPQREREEFILAIKMLKSRHAPGGGKVAQSDHSVNNPLCNAIDGKTVVSVIIDGEFLINQSILNQLSLAYDEILICNARAEEMPRDSVEYRTATRRIQSLEQILSEGNAEFLRRRQRIRALMEIGT